MTEVKEKNKEKLEEEIDLTLRKLEIILRHKENVKESCERLGKKLIQLGEIDFGIRLISAGYLHDDSKFFGIEWEGMLQKENKELLIESIKNHQSQNSHHSEFWCGVENMPRIALAELVCDLYARSMEFGSNLRDYIKNIYAPKHGLTPNCKISKIIKEFVDLLLEEPFKELK